MPDNPNRPENTNVERAAPKPDPANTNRRAEMTQAAVAMTKASKWEAEVEKLKPSNPEERPQPTETKKADPGPMTRGLERKLPEL